MNTALETRDESKLILEAFYDFTVPVSKYIIENKIDTIPNEYIVNAYTILTILKK